MLSHRTMFKESSRIVVIVPFMHLLANNERCELGEEQDCVRHERTDIAICGCHDAICCKRTVIREECKSSYARDLDVVE